MANWKRRIAVEWLILVILFVASIVIGSAIYGVERYQYEKEKNAFAANFIETYGENYKANGFVPDEFLRKYGDKEPEKLSELSNEELNARLKFLEKEEEKLRQRALYEEYLSGQGGPRYWETTIISMFFVPCVYLLIVLIRATIWSVRTIRT